MCVSRHNPSTGKSQTIRIDDKSCPGCDVRDREISNLNAKLADAEALIKKMTQDRDLILAQGADLCRQLNKTRAELVMERESKPAGSMCRGIGWIKSELE